MSTLVNPLNRLLVHKAPWCWTDTCQEAFLKLKEALLNSPVLAHHDPSQPIRLAVDASSYGLGDVLSHITEDGE